jgi:hypothetical protein
MRHITRTLVFIPRQYTYPGVPVRSLNPDFNPLRRGFYAWRKYDLHNWLIAVNGNTLTGTGTNFTAAGH